MRINLPLYVLSLAISTVISDQETVSKVDSSKYSTAKEKRYLIYDVNHGEGFNLRRDVYMRIANTVRLLREAGENYHLVLPPWGGLYHWDRQEVRQPWGKFFDLKALNEFVPVMEFEDFIQETSSSPIDQVIYLQHYAEGWGERYEYKYDKRECNDGNRLQYKKDGSLWKGWFFSFPNIRAKNFACVSFQGDSGTLKDLILKEYSQVESIFVDRGETALHSEYGGYQYWAARRSMRYAPHLLEIAAKFRKEHLNSTDEMGKTVLVGSWKEEKSSRTAIGGDYICAHWRRRDFVRAHGKELPSIKGTARILNKLAKKYKVSKIFLATDAPKDEVTALQEYSKFPIVRFDEKETLTDGEIAIVDQIICSRARYFTGSHVSTFSFRIQEDREILGFPVETTFNRMCADDQKSDCEQPAKWTIVY